MKLTMGTPDPALLELPYYHLHFTDVNQVCDALTPYMNQDGTYLLRDSRSRPGTLTISVMHLRQVNHFNVEYTPGNGYLLYEKYFKTVKEMVEYYSTHDIPNREHVKHILLNKPVYSVRIRKEERRPSLGLLDPSGSAAGGTTLGRRLFPRQKSMDAITGQGTAHPPRRVQSERPHSEQTGSADPVLPLSPPPKKQWIPNILKGKKSRSNSVSSEGGGSNPADRPMLPIPYQAGNAECNYRPPSVSAEDYNDTQESIYTEPRAEIDHTNLLVNLLKLDEERARYEMCHCGILVMDSELPQGWSVHRSQERDTSGRLFFVSADNVTSWTLPQAVQTDLTTRQRQTLSRLREDGMRPGIYRHGAGSRDS